MVLYFPSRKVVGILLNPLFPLQVFLFIFLVLNYHKGIMYIITLRTLHVTNIHNKNKKKQKNSLKQAEYALT